MRVRHFFVVVYCIGLWVVQLLMKYYNYSFHHGKKKKKQIENTKQKTKKKQIENTKQKRVTTFEYRTRIDRIEVYYIHH